MSHEIVGNKVRELRAELGLTQEELAQRVGVARQSIISIERGRFMPTIETALRLSTALKAPVEEIFWLMDGP